jgi:VIT1/CCC1 family predicted Fe2+/Mn2+ transporter
MMAGVFLDLQSERDRAKVEAKQRRAKIQRDSGGSIEGLIEKLQNTGLHPATLHALRDDLQKNPDIIIPLESALSASTETVQARPTAQALWMFVSDLFAGLTPVLAFAFLPLAKARWVSLAMTLVLLILLGYGRARIGQRAIIPTVGQTVAIAGLAAVAGVAIGQLINRLSF